MTPDKPAAALEKIRTLIERKPMEKAEIERMLAAMNVPGDFDTAQISWQPDYDSFFYQQLSSRARRIYLFRDEYIFDFRDAATGERDILVREASKHGSFSGRLYEGSQKTIFAVIGRILGKRSGSLTGSFTAAIRAVGRRS